MPAASVSSFQNIAEIKIPVSARITVRVVTGSPNIQKVKVTNQDGSVDFVFTGTGEDNLLGEAHFTGPQELGAIFHYGETASALKPSDVRSGGPYTVGDHNTILVAADNDDDSDYNDCAIYLTWATPKE